MRAKKEYSDHFDFNMMKKFNLNFQASLLNVVIVFDTKRSIFLGLKLSREKSRIVRKTNIITSIILMFIFLRKRLLYAYLTE